jgi:hypothetical protein
MENITTQERTKKRAKLTELTAKIKQLLLNDKRYRENDALLVNRIQRDEMIALNLDVNTMSLNDFFRIRIDKKISSEDSITRLRREVQEYFPETRGDNYKKRQSKQVDVQGDLHEVENEIKSGKLKQWCDHCQGSGVYESHPCNVCNPQEN